jgi:hypothetical protein
MRSNQFNSQIMKTTLEIILSSLIGVAIGLLAYYGLVISNPV